MLRRYPQPALIATRGAAMCTAFYRSVVAGSEQVLWLGVSQCWDLVKVAQCNRRVLLT